ncbi:MAG: flagellar biosynthesis anti-sigma factor FlgM [Candidatus Alkaliphilus sp. MAG34]|nr:flagellar biosynthesis anti-sigma factor FlgM [Clostridiales bacterium]
MKIFNNSNINKIIQVYGRAKTKKVDSVENVEVPKDELQLSSKAKEYQIAMKAFKNLPEIREDLVKELKDKIEQGTYNVTGEEIADKIIESAIIDKKI